VENYWLGPYDISHILVGSASQLARPLRGKIHVIVGTNNTFYLDKPVRLLQRRIESLGYQARFTYIPVRTHFDLYEGHLVRRIAEQMYRGARPDATWNRGSPPIDPRNSPTRGSRSVWREGSRGPELAPDLRKMW
jgi:hypothetical protein